MWDFTGKRLVPVSARPGYQQFAKFSPDGRKVGFVRDNNLYVTDLTTGAETALTTALNSSYMADQMANFGIVVGSVYRRTILGRPPALVLRPHPAGLRNRLAPFVRCVLLFGSGPSGYDGFFLGYCDAEVGVILLPVAGLGIGTTGPDRLAAVILIVSAICVPIW